MLHPLKSYLGHFCRFCGWWRYGEGVRFLESEELHRYRTGCRESLAVMGGGWRTGKEMRAALELACAEAKDGTHPAATRHPSEEGMRSTL